MEDQNATGAPAPTTAPPAATREVTPIQKGGGAPAPAKRTGKATKAAKAPAAAKKATKAAKAPAATKKAASTSGIVRSPSTVSKEGTKVSALDGKPYPVTKFPTVKVKDSSAPGGYRIDRGPVTRPQLTEWRAKNRKEREAAAAAKAAAKASKATKAAKATKASQ